jgi:hypothetical protein
MRITVVLAAVAGALAGTADAQPDTVELQKALDRPVNVDIADAPVKEVFARLSEKTGVRFVIAPEVLTCLPYGEQTRMVVRLKNITLRKALSPMLHSHGLQWSIDGEAVRISPGEPLARMGRRASYDELSVLGKMQTARLKPAGDPAAVLRQVRQATGNADLRLAFEVEGDANEALAGAAAALPATPAEWLDALCRGRPWTWYLWGDEIKIVRRRDQVERQLQEVISLEYQNVRLTDALLDLARQARVRLQMDPGALGYLREEQREAFNLVMADATVAQALEVISGATGLEFARTDSGLRVRASEALKAQAATTRPRTRSPYFVVLKLPGPEGSTLQVFMRPSELPDDLAEAIEAARDRQIERLRSALGAGGDPNGR